MDFETIYKTYFKDVFLYLRSLSADSNIAEEITQETLEKALKSIDRFDGTKDIRAWLFTIAKNSYYTYCKRQNRFTGEEPLENLADTHSILIEQFLDEEAAFHIHQFLHDMKEPYKEVFTLRVSENSHLKRSVCFSAKVQAGPVWLSIGPKHKSKNI